MAALKFEILLDHSLAQVTSVPELKSVLNKRVMSIINDFEDGEWLYDEFNDYIWDNITETALSEKERSVLVNKNHAALRAAAKNLRLTDNDPLGQGSEIAEIFLYGVMKDHFNALPVVPKIFYKQNVQDNAKGADSVHIVVDGNDFTLWFGEAKFYNSLDDDRLYKIVSSVIEMLGTEKLKKENRIVTSVKDIYDLPIDDNVRANILSALSAPSMDSLKKRIHVPILLIHECNITSGHKQISDEYRNKIVNFHCNRAESYFKKQISKSSKVFKYYDVTFHIILFPVPNKDVIVEAFNKEVSHYKANIKGISQAKGGE